MGQLAIDIHDEAAARIPAAPVTDPADLLTGPELLSIFAKVVAAVAALELRAAGSKIRANTGAPSNNVGNDFDLYLNTANGDLWGKDAGVWGFLLNLRGPQGNQGIQGATGGQGERGPKGTNGTNGANGTDGTNGNDGRDGNRISAPAAAPAPSDGQEGDLAIVASTGDLQEKTATGWVTRGNLKGPSGSGGGGTAGVASFNTRTGAVVLTAADVLGVVNSANQLAGGLHSILTGAQMQLLPANLRDYGMRMYVYGDSADNNGRYDLANDLKTWIKAGSDAAGQFAAYSTSAPYNSQSAYVTYPDANTGGLRIFHSLNTGTAVIQPAPLSSGNVLSTLWEEISPSAVSSAAPLYTTTGQNTNGSMTQKAVTDLLASSVAAIVGVTTAGVQTAYATAQQAAAALSSTGGVILSKVDIEGPLALSGGVSLYAPGRTVYLRQNIAGDTLTLQSDCSVECKLIERSRDGTGYALVVKFCTASIRANVSNTRGYNAIFCQGANVDFAGNAELTDNPALVPSGERITVLSVGGTLVYRGNITLNATTNTSVMEGLTSFSGAEVDFNGVIRVTNKGRAGRNQNGVMRLRGGLLTKDQGFVIANGKTDIYLSIDTRDAVSPTTANAALQISVNVLNDPSFYVILHAGSELLTPAGVPSIVNTNSSYPVTVQVGGVINQTNAPDNNITLKSLTFPTTDSFSILNYAASIALDFNADTVRTLAATGNVAFAASVNIAPLRTKELFITNTTASAITLSFPAGWTFLPGPAPTSLAAGKQAVLTLRALGTTDATIKAAYVAQA